MTAMTEGIRSAEDSDGFNYISIGSAEDTGDS
jgi:hypothetical protein